MRRQTFRRLVHTDGADDRRRQAAPLHEIRAVHERHYNAHASNGLGTVLELSDALFPPLRLGAMYYKEQSLLAWANGATSGWDRETGAGQVAEVHELEQMLWYKPGDSTGAKGNEGVVIIGPNPPPPCPSGAPSPCPPYLREF